MTDSNFFHFTEKNKTKPDNLERQFDTVKFSKYFIYNLVAV